ncbi:hypothetical protein UFOVP331_179 [uncultured Caudovirales phage]|uniref:Uncharacterized protein n=1 Tax=uncultured Caudovirales phage TaxID=2100421 RepID=A0A6J5M407_9CAUD|nr:hypothetical protein UFOVP331_179 [uncultured Caudovirales phage]
MFKRIEAKSKEDLEKIVKKIKEWFTNRKEEYEVEPTSETRKFMDLETKKLVEKTIEGLKIKDLKSEKNTTVKFIPLLDKPETELDKPKPEKKEKTVSMKLEIGGGENESAITGKIKDLIQTMDIGTLHSYNKKNTKSSLKETIAKSELKKIIREEIYKLI